MSEQFMKRCPQCGAPEGGCHCADIGLGASKEQPLKPEAGYDQAIVRELKERAQQEYEKTVKPLIEELRAKAKSFPDMDTTFASAFEAGMNTAEAFFAMDDYLQSLNSQGWVDELRQINEWLKVPRTANEFQRTCDSRIASGRGALIISKDLWGSITGRTSWERLAEDERIKRAKQK